MMEIVKEHWSTQKLIEQKGIAFKYELRFLILNLNQ